MTGSLIVVKLDDFQVHACTLRAYCMPFRVVTVQVPHHLMLWGMHTHLQLSHGLEKQLVAMTQDQSTDLQNCQDHPHGAASVHYATH